MARSALIYSERTQELKSDFLTPRNYHPKVVESQFSRIKNLPGNNYSDRRKKSLEKKERNKNNQPSRVIAPVDFNPILPNINQTFSKHYRSMIFKKPELREVFEAPPMAALRQPPNLRKVLCRSTLFNINRVDKFLRNSHRNAPGWKKCGKGSSTCCPFALPSTKTVSGQVTGFVHNIKEAVDCETSNCVYYWKCVKDKCKQYPRCEYIGLTRRPFKTRLAEHKQYVRSKLLDKPSGFHFNKAGHNLSHLNGLVLEKVTSGDPFVLRAREYLYIQKFDTYRNGLNKEP